MSLDCEGKPGENSDTNMEHMLTRHKKASIALTRK